MTQKDLLKNNEFEEVSETKVDSKNRITLGSRTGSVKIFSYKIYRNSVGQYVLDPQVTIPAHEAWLFQNKDAKRAVQKGLEDARKKRLVKAHEDYSRYLDKSD